MQAVKKAREFEIRKVSRRLKQARDSEDKDGHPSSSPAAGAAAAKLQHQLEAAKALGLDDLAKRVSESCMLLVMNQPANEWPIF